jgi:putative ABC transport system ATP-binding protein
LDVEVQKVQPIIKVVDLWKQYGEDGQNGIALRGANLEISAGEVVALFGKSGSGKTTLLNLIAGLDRPTKGRIEVDGHDMEGLGEKGRTDLRRRRLGFVFQFFNLLPTLTAFENVYLSLELLGKPDRSTAEDALAAVGLEGKGARYPHELSGGEQQRIAIARAIVKEPALILADEPTGNLDTATGNQVLELLQQRCREHKMSLVMVTHTPLTCKFADRILRMVDGVITEPDSCEETDR